MILRVGENVGPTSMIFSPGDLRSTNPKLQLSSDQLTLEKAPSKTNMEGPKMTPYLKPEIHETNHQYLGFYRLDFGFWGGIIFVVYMGENTMPSYMVVIST